MHSDRTVTMPRPRGSSYRDSFPSRAIRLLTTGPAQAKSPAARWAANVLAVAGAALLIWAGVIHLQLWFDGYRSISVVGMSLVVEFAGAAVLVTAAALVLAARPANRRSPEQSF
jgi:hypothetical protein